MLFVSVSMMRTQQFRWRSVCIISWMTLRLDLDNKCALKASCVPSARITHNPGTGVITMRQGFINVNQCSNQGGRKCYLWALGVEVGGGMALFFPGQGRKASQGNQQRMAMFER